MRALAFSILCLTSIAHADALDYRLDSPGWNGLSRFVAEAQTLGCAVTSAETLDWARLGPRDVLFIIYPRSPIDPEAMGSYLARGGRLLLADDFGTAEPAFSALQLNRIGATLDGVPREPDHPELPVAHASLLTALGRSTPRLVANHPAAFDSALPATFALSPGQALVVEGRVGLGRFVALADPSVLINNMIELESNRAFARALITELCGSGASGDRVHLVTGVFHAPPVPSHASAQGTGLLAQFNDLFIRLNRATEELLEGSLALPIAVLLCAAALALAWTALLRTRVVRHADGLFVRADGSDRRSAFGLVDALPRGPGRSDHAVALAMLHGEVMRRLSQLLGPLPASLGRDQLSRRIEKSLGADLRLAADRFFRIGAAAPSAVSRRTFLRALKCARPILAQAAPEDRG